VHKFIALEEETAADPQRVTADNARPRPQLRPLHRIARPLDKPPGPCDPLAGPINLAQGGKLALPGNTADMGHAAVHRNAGRPCNGL
jgi:hypothetical protein